MSSARYGDLSDDQLRLIHTVCHEFENALRNNEGVISIESQIEAVSEDIQVPLFLELMAIELESRVARGEKPDVGEYEGRFPNHRQDISQAFSEIRDEPIEEEMPRLIGRYRIKRPLGSGSFGHVYLAHDEQLQRWVAIKVPHRELIARREDARTYLNEAQAVASLDHPHIVPVYDVGRSEEFPCYTVSKYVEGTDLAQLLKQSRLSWQAAAKLVAHVAEALHHAHTQGLVHRDVKPGNILLDEKQNAYLVDFGLSLKDNDIASGPKYAGTPSYMSPEQARGEGHRVDGRSDIYSLGTVLYELLTGRRTFVDSSSPTELLNLIASHDPKPPRQIDDSVPSELERICLKAIARRTAERYTTALDMARELRLFLENPDTPRSIPPTPVIPPTNTPTPVTPDSDSQPLRIVPRGLRSFDRNDATFFLKLLPGPRDHTGLPDSIRFWKDRIEELDAENSFQVGLIYGPSGCGKTSLMRAGLLPQLSDNIEAVYIEATTDDTETRLLNALRNQCPRLSSDLGLTQAMSVIRRGECTDPKTKVLIVLDQFEQWLHAQNDADTELVQSLRQCDGHRLQCIVMVRDEFWLAVSRFMRDLEIDLVPGQNITLTDLFDLKHARRVLRAFGRAFDRIPHLTQEATKPQRDFVKQAVESLAEEGKVTCVRLSLFAEMMKGKMWTPTTLKEGGGAEGIGVTFLDEAFSARSANPRHREHQKAARAVLRLLLPASGSDIKGQMHAYDALCEAAGQTSDPERFDELIRILDRDLRLITPTDSGGIAFSGDGTDIPNRLKYYQLTHDFLVPSVRTWLTRQQQETRQGRAELRLARRAELWTARPENRHLPSAWEWATIRTRTSRSNWTRAQRQMMQKAGRVLGARSGIGLLVMLVLAIAVQQMLVVARVRNLTGRTQTAVEAMRNSQGSIVPLAIEDLENLPRDMVLSELHARFQDSDPSQKIALAYALAHFGSVEVDFLVAQIRTASTESLKTFSTALGRSKSESLKEMQRAAAASDIDKDWQFKHRLAFVELQLGETSLARDMCQLRPDPIQRTTFIEKLASWRGDDLQLVSCIRTVNDSALSSGLCLGIGSTPQDRLTAQMRRAWEPVFIDWFLNKPDTGTHSAAGWALRHWQVDLPEIAPTKQPSAGRDWYINSVGMTLLRIPAGSFVRKTPYIGLFDLETPQTDQQVILTRSFFLADREVTLGAFKQFLDELDPSEEKLKSWSHSDPYFHSTLSDDHPAYTVSWFNAVRFCNWLSLNEGLQVCYQRTGKKEPIRTYPYDAWQLLTDANGYRLPTEAEWEYSCRARTVTRFPWGDDSSRLLSYAVARAPHPASCGSKLPNGWGLFDLLGNINEWCHDWRAGYSSEPTITDPSGPPAKTSNELRCCRGGPYSSILDVNLNLSKRGGAHPDEDQQPIGFRVARTPSKKEHRRKLGKNR